MNIHSPADCAKKFISNHKVGMILFFGIVLGNLMKKSSQEKEEAKHRAVTLNKIKNS